MELWKFKRACDLVNKMKRIDSEIEELEDFWEDIDFIDDKEVGIQFSNGENKLSIRKSEENVKLLELITDTLRKERDELNKEFEKL